MRNFRDLRAWQEAHQLTLHLYPATKMFPKDELFGLTSQLRRSCVSIEANIAEGCGRQTDGELARFVQIALGSCSETECHLLLALDLGYLQQHLYRDLQQRVVNVRKMLSGLLNSLAESGEQKPESRRSKAKGAAQ